MLINTQKALKGSARRPFAPATQAPLLRPLRCRHSEPARPDLQTAGPAVVTDAAVPEGHKGLHNFLYADGADTQHATSAYRFREGEDDGSSITAVPAYLAAREGDKPLGVYALYDARRALQYVGYSRNMVLAIKGHLARVGEDRCAFARTMVFANKAMASRTNLERQAAAWLEEAGTLPPGNGVEREDWEGAAAASLDPSLMSPAELAEYEDKKLKMRKAMGENLGDAAAGESEDAAQRRAKLMQAVEGDNWSAVIDAQTKATIDPATRPAGTPDAASSSSSGPMASPFATAAVHRSIGNSPASSSPAARHYMELTEDNVDAALDEVRPYLIADGGNVEVAGIEDGVVALRLQGACGTCASSQATMKMGIERALKSKFGDAIKDIIQVDAKEPGATPANVDAHLDMFRGAVRNFNGTVDVVSVADGVCTLRYVGPPPLGNGLKAAVKDKFPELKEVVLV